MISQTPLEALGDFLAHCRADPAFKPCTGPGCNAFHIIVTEVHEDEWVPYTTPTEICSGVEITVNQRKHQGFLKGVTI